MQFLARVGILSVVCFCLLCGVAFGHSDFKPKSKTDPCVDYEKTTVIEYFWPDHRETRPPKDKNGDGDTDDEGETFISHNQGGDGSHSCEGHWNAYRRQQKPYQSEEDPPEENEPTLPNTDSDPTPTEGGEGSTTPTSGTEPVTLSGTSGEVSYGIPTQLKKFAGNKQSGQPNEKLPDPLVVQVLDIDDRPVPGVKILFEVLTSCDGCVPATIDKKTRASIETNKDGLASIKLTLGKELGTVKIQVRAEDIKQTQMMKAYITQVKAAPSVQRRLTTSWGRIKMHNTVP